MGEEIHWLSKIITGKGTLKDYKKEFDMINAGTQQFTTNSQLFPKQITLGQVSVPDMTNNTKEMIFEYIIYYKVHPTALQSLDKSTGKVKIDMTEKEGKQLDPDVNEMKIEV